MYVHMYCIGSLIITTCCADNRLARKVRISIVCLYSSAF